MLEVEFRHILQSTNEEDVLAKSVASQLLFLSVAVVFILFFYSVYFSLCGWWILALLPPASSFFSAIVFQLVFPLSLSFFL